MSFLIKLHVVLVMILLQLQDNTEGAVTLTTSPSGASVGDDVILTCTNTDNIRNVTWKINGGNENYFNPTLSRRVFGNVFRDFTISTTTTEYRLLFTTYIWDTGSTWQCLDNGMSSNVVTLFGPVTTTTTTTTTTSASGVTQTPTTNTLSDENELLLIGGLCALGGLLVIVLTIIACWCLGSRKPTHKTVEARPKNVRDPASSIQYIRDPTPVQYIRDPTPVQYTRKVHKIPRATFMNPVYDYREDKPRRSLVLRGSNGSFASSTSELYDPMRFARRSFAASNHSDLNRTSSRYVDVVFDSFEGRDPEDLFETSEVYARILKRPKQPYV